MKAVWSAMFGLVLLAIPPADAGTVTLKEGGRVLTGTLISRPETLTGNAVVTISRPSEFRVFQFDLDQIASIQSATEAIRIFKEATIIRDGTGEDAAVVRRFTAGMEVRVDRQEGDWAYVIPEAEGLVKDQGWVPASALVAELDVGKYLEEKAKEPPVEAAPTAPEATSPGAGTQE